MKTYEDRPLPVVVAITCDRCNVTHRDVVERQEFLSFSDTGGYGNVVFGDGSPWSIDLCQYCTATVLGKFIKFKDGRNYTSGE